MPVPQFLFDLFVLFVLLFALLNIVWMSIKNGISPMPSSSKQLNACLEALPKLPKNALIYDLGAAWGSAAFFFAKAFPDASVIGYENSRLPYLFSKLRLRFFPQKNLEFQRKDFYTHCFDQADLLFVYLYPGAMEKLEKKLTKERKKNLYVLSHTFALPRRKALFERQINDLYSTKVYVYQIISKQSPHL